VVLAQIKPPKRSELTLKLPRSSLEISERMDIFFREKVRKSTSNRKIYKLEKKK